MESKIVWTSFRRQVRGFGTRMIAKEYGIIIVTSYVAQHVPVAWWPLLAIVIGHSQWTLSDNIGHWASHSTLFRKESLNRSMEWLYFYPVFGTWKEWTEIHKLHHRYVGQAGQDPHVATFTRWGLGTRKFWLCFLLSPLSDFKKSLEGLWVFRNRKLTLFWAVVASLATCFHLWGLLALWMVSYFTTRVYAMFFSETSEHWNAEREKGKTETVWGTRNLEGVFYRLYKRHADHLHKLHHSFPGVPPERLAEFHVAKRQQEPSDDFVKVQRLPTVLKELQLVNY